MIEIVVNRTALALVQGDITTMATDAIVNAANERLAHGGGVAGAISRHGGPEIQRQSDAWVMQHGRVPTGSAAITGAGKLAAKYVIHAVGPIYDGTSRSAELLASAVRSSLALADERGLKSVALPAISTGIYGYPLDEAAHVILSSALGYLDGQTDLQRVVFCLYGQQAYDSFAKALNQLTGAEDGD
jgi:O-acetyl-ADP-ribose deacetylase (regulator of RNase III)